MRARVKALGERMLPPGVRQERADRRRAIRAEGAERRRTERIAEQRRALLDDAQIRAVDVAGRTRYGRRVSRFTAAAASAHNLRLVTDVLVGEGIDYFLVPGRSRTRHVVGVHRDERERLLAAMRRRHGEGPLYAMKPSSDPWTSGAVLYADGSLPGSLERQEIIRFGEILLGPQDQVLADLTYGCDVEFWRDGQEVLDDEAAGAERVAGLRSQTPPDILADSLVGPRPNTLADVLPADARVLVTRRVADREHPTFQDFHPARLDAVDFPVDVVYTWVDGADPQLAAKRDRYRDGGSGPQIHARETGASRYVSRDELKYSLRSLEMYAPFVRNIYIVTDGQTPSWLNTDAAGIRVVDHKEIFADPTALPVFNSHAIGTQLHHIAGLSEHYLYFNDDVFAGRPVTAEHFFHSNGIVKIPFSPFQLGVGEPHPEEPAPNSAGKNVRRLLLAEHGKFTVNKFKHTPHPQLRTVMADIEERFADEVDRTSRSRFRSVTDIAMGASLHHHHAYLTGRAVPGSYKLRYIDVARPEATEALAELAATRRYDFFCLNDVFTPDTEQERIANELHAFLESYFPFPSRFEREE